MSVAHILKSKGTAVVTAAPSDNVGAIVRTLSEKRIGAVIVAGQGKAIEGIISERDVVRALADHGAKALGLTAADIMTSKVKTCDPSDSEAELMAMMTVNRIRHLPVVENGKLGGMISIGDVVKFRMEAVEREAEEMKSYIATAG